MNFVHCTLMGGMLQLVGRSSLYQTQQSTHQGPSLHGDWYTAVYESPCNDLNVAGLSTAKDGSVRTCPVGTALWITLCPVSSHLM